MTNWSRRDFLARTGTALALSSSAGALLEACGAGGSATEQTLRVYLRTQPGTFDPNLQQWDYEAAVARNTFETLVRPKVDLSDVRPAAASLPQISADGLTWTFKLRPDGKWSDGKPVTAQDFVFGFQRILNPTLAAPYAAPFFTTAISGGQAYDTTDSKNAGAVQKYLQGLGLHAPDDHTFVIQLQRPIPYFKWVVSLWIAAPVRRDVVSADPLHWALKPQTAVSNGWFKLSEASKDHVTLVANDQYSGTKPQLQKIVMPIITDDSKAYASYQNGELDMAIVPQADSGTNVNNPEVIKEPQLTVYSITLNTLQAPFDNTTLRQAFAKAIDRDKLVQDVLHGRGIPAATFIPKGMSGYQPDLGSYQKFDLEAARKLLSQSTVFKSIINQVSLNYRADRPDDKTIAEFIAAQLNSNLGLQIQLGPVESRELSRRLLTGNYQMAALVGWGADYPDQQDWFDTLVTPASGPENRGNNFPAYSNPTYDKLVQQADRTLDESKRISIYAHAHQLLCQDVPQIFMYQRTGWALAKSYVKGIHPAGNDDYPFVGDFDTPSIYIASH
jgi:oligopeptide transport system substrate-binding protein